jgi:hypothetical protein
MQVKGAKFVRYWPKNPTDGTGGFDCNPDYSLPLTKQYEPLPAGWG